MGEPSLAHRHPRRPPEDRLDSWKEIAAYLNRDVTTVQRWEKREGMPVHRHLHDKMGSVYASRAELDAWARSRNLRAAQENGSDATVAEFPPQSRSAGDDMDLPEPGGRLSCRWQRRAALAIGASLWLQKTEYFWRNPIADARFQTVTDFDGVAAGRRGVTRRSFRGVSVGPRRTDGRLGYAGRFGTVPQLDPRERAGTRQSIGPHPGVLAGWLFVTFWVRKQNGSTRRRHQHLGGANAGRTAEAIPGRRGRVRLVARRLPTRVPHARTRRPDVRVRRQPATGGSAHLHCACRAALSLSVVGARRGIHLLRPGCLPGQIGHLAHPANRRDCSGTDHVAQWARELIRSCWIGGR